MAGKSKSGRADTRGCRFWRKVSRGDGCWLWTGSTLPAGYGQIDQRGAHRVSYEIHFGPIPDGMHVCHKCDVPACVRPDHLFLGTPLDNMRDKIAKGRDTRGEAVNTAKLTPRQVEEIRERYAKGERQTSLAKSFGVGQPHVSSIVRGKCWGPGRGGRWSVLA